MVRLSAGYVLALAGLFAWMLPGLSAKNHFQANDRSVFLALDAESLDALQGWPAVQDVPCTHIVVDETASASTENAVRAFHKSIIWHVADFSRPSELLARVQPGDWGWLSSESSLDHPLLYLGLAGRLADGGVLAPEFEINRALPEWVTRFHVRAVKAHVLGTRELLDPKPVEWQARLCRAVQER